MGSTPYVVRQGDYLTEIAYRHGTTVDEILKLPENAELKKKRTNPEILAPLDVVNLPDPKVTWLKASVGTTNSYKARLPTVTLRAVLQGADGIPLAGKAVTTTAVRVDDSPLVTDGTGLLKFDVLMSERVVDVVVTETQDRFQLRVGHLDPHDHRSGVLSRLRHLGHVADESRLFQMREHLHAIDPQTVALPAAVSSFQVAQGQTPTGELDDQLRADIRDVHGS